MIVFMGPLIKVTIGNSSQQSRKNGNSPVREVGTPSKPAPLFALRWVIYAGKYQNGTLKQQIWGGLDRSPSMDRLVPSKLHVSCLLPEVGTQPRLQQAKCCDKVKLSWQVPLPARFFFF